MSTYQGYTKVWPIFKIEWEDNGVEKSRKSCGKDARIGDIDCPFCDALVYYVGDEMEVGDECWKCKATVVELINN